MTLLERINERHRSFHASIARAASRNAMAPAPKPPKPFNYEPLWWHCMWFHDLVTMAPKPTDRTPRIETIRAAVCHVFNVTKEEIVSSRRSGNIALARQVAMYLSKKITSRSYPEIGRMFGGKNHSTVLHAARVMAERRKINPELNDIISKVEARLGVS